MAPANDFDTVVIGAGVAGLAAATLLARDHAQRVLVLERAPFIGGRTLSFVGRGDKVVADGIEMDAHAFRKALPLAHTYLGPCSPGIEEIFARGLLDGRTFEAGGHGLFWGNQGRIGELMEHLGLAHRLPLNRGLAFVRWHGEDKPTEAFQVRKNEPYPWMSSEGYRATMEQLRAMASATPQDVADAMNVSLQSWFERRDMHPEAYAYIKVLAASQTAQAEPAMTPAGDFLGYMMTAPRLGMNLVKGSVATADAPGCIAIPLAMESLLAAHGGEVWRNAAVRGVLVEGGRVRGVRVRWRDGGARGAGDDARAVERTIRGARVICTMPPPYLFDVLPREAFPGRWVAQLTREFWGAGLLTGWCGMRRPQLPDIGLDAGSFVYMPGITRPDEGFIGVVDMVMCDFAAWGDGSARRAPRGKHDYYFSTALTDREMRDPARVGRVVQLCEDWARRTFTHWDEDCEFIMWTPSPEAYGLWRPVGAERPDVVSPWVEGLYFAGDQYGRRLWGGGVDGAALSAVMCVDAITGGDQERRIFAPCHRGLPDS